ncbi:rna binding protein [Colletotrichum incanum]|uniref:Rna binding protein n=1 Tax=Colletotrichum incanum TaxID=1573173 RepID=A0A162Q6S8_COLIC|nr:rna binding protein [Colletotrichum incanum]
MVQETHATTKQSPLETETVLVQVRSESEKHAPKRQARSTLKVAIPGSQSSSDPKACHSPAEDQLLAAVKPPPPHVAFTREYPEPEPSKHQSGQGQQDWEGLSANNSDDDIAVSPVSGPGIPDEFRVGSIPLPGRPNKKIWPLMPVVSDVWSSRDYEERFGYVVGELKRAVDGHDKLRDRARFIDYDLMMVGATPETASPSILIKCKRSDAKALKLLFDKTANSRLFCRRGSRWLQLFKDSPPSKPPFKLIYIPSRTDPLIWVAGDTATAIFDNSHSTMCSALVEYQGRVATIGLTLEIDGRSLLMTVEHLFNKAFPEEVLEEDLETTSDKSDGDLDELEIGRFWINDSDDDSTDADSSDEYWDDRDDGVKDGVENEDLNKAGISVTRENESTTTSGTAEPTNKSKTPELLGPRDLVERVSTPHRLPATSPFLHWTCLSMDDEILGPKRCNYIYRPSPSMLRTVAASPPSHTTQILMVSGICNFKEKILLGRPSYLASRPGQELCQVWNVVFDTYDGILPGECGSIIVDKRTHEVYGHLVGTDVLGTGRVVPLTHTIDQMKSAFGASSIKLPEQQTSSRRSGKRALPMAVGMTRAAFEDSPGLHFGLDAFFENSSKPDTTRFPELDSNSLSVPISNFYGALPLSGDTNSHGTLKLFDGSPVRTDIAVQIIGFGKPQDEFVFWKETEFSCSCSCILTPFRPDQLLRVTSAISGQTSCARGFIMSVTACEASNNSQAIEVVQNTPEGVSRSMAWSIFNLRYPVRPWSWGPIDFSAIRPPQYRLEGLHIEKPKYSSSWGNTTSLQLVFTLWAETERAEFVKIADRRSEWFAPKSFSRSQIPGLVSAGDGNGDGETTDEARESASVDTEATGSNIEGAVSKGMGSERDFRQSHQ